MTTQEDRLATVERKIAALELRRMYDERKAEENTPSALGVNFREINENMTILLGIASAQEQNIKETQEDIKNIKERLDTVDGRLDIIDGRLGAVENTLSDHTSLLKQILERLPK